MPILQLPMFTDGESVYSCYLYDKNYNFRLYYLKGQSVHWYLDILDADNQPLSVGIPVVPGAYNTLKGLRKEWEDVVVQVVAQADYERNIDNAPGSTLNVVWAAPGTDMPTAEEDRFLLPLDFSFGRV